MSSLVRRIVVPVDFSETSDQALRVACAYAVELGAEVVLVHVLRTTEYGMGSGIFFWTDEILKASEAAATTAVEARAGGFRDAGVKYSTVVLEGVPEDEIVEHAATVKADLIVIGTHGRTGLARIAIGSVAQRVAANAPCPVLLVGARAGATTRNAK